jgi:hypothetical protein
MCWTYTASNTESRCKNYDERTTAKNGRRCDETLDPFYQPLRGPTKASNDGGLEKEMRQYGESTTAVLNALRQCGPMTRVELDAATGISKSQLSPTVSRMNKNTPKVGKQIFIVDWVYDAEGGRRYPRAVYAIGNGEDARKPKANVKANKKRYEAKRRTMFSTNSVFNLGLTRDQVRAQTKGMQW